MLQVLLDQNFALVEDEWAAVMDCVYFGATEALRVVVNHIVETKISGNKISSSTLAKLGVIRAFHLAIKLFDRLAMLVFLEHQVLVRPLLETESQGQIAVELAIDVQNVEAFQLLVEAGQIISNETKNLLRETGSAQWLALIDNAEQDK